MPKKINILLLWLSISLYVFYFGLISFKKYVSFNFHDFDLAVHDLTTWNILHGSIFNSILGIPFLGNHMHIILFFIAPVYALFSHPLTLLFLQTLALGLAAFPLYNLAKSLLDENWALVISLTYLFYPALGYTNLYEFHPTAFATLFLMFTLYYYEQGSFIKSIVFMALSSICQENIPLAVIMLGVLSFFKQRGKIWILAPILLGGFYFLICLLTTAHFNKNTVQFTALYRHLGSAPLLVRMLVRKEVFIYLLYIFLPLSFLPLLKPLSLLPSLPFFLQHMLSIRLTELTIFYHYTAEIIPFIFVSFVYAIRFLLNKQYVTSTRFLKVSILAIVILSNIYLGPHFAVFRGFTRQYRKDYLDNYKQEFINKIPANAAVVATFEFLPHLSHRRFLYSFHHVYMGFHTLSNKKYELPENVEFALLDFNDSLTFAGFYADNNYKRLKDFFLKGNWAALDFMETIVLCKKNIASRFTLCQKITEPDKEIKNKTAINIEDDIELIGYNIDNIENSEILEISLYWKCLRQTKKDINMVLDIVDGQGNLAKRSIHYVCYRIFPTNSWQQGEVFKERLRLKIPPDSLQNQYNLKAFFFDYRNRQICATGDAIDNLGRVLLTQIK